MASKLICLVGMCGAGKSEVAEYMIKKRKLGFLRFGQIVLDEVKKIIEKRGGKSTEALERKIREGFRKKYGMAAMAVLNIPKFDKLLKSGNTIGDGLYSWEEYLTLKKRYGKKFICVAVYAPPSVRYLRLEGRAEKHGLDEKLRFRSFTKEEAASRDKSEIENLNKAGPIAMADYTVINNSDLVKLRGQVDEIMKRIFD